MSCVTSFGCVRPADCAYHFEVTHGTNRKAELRAKLECESKVKNPRTDLERLKQLIRDDPHFELFPDFQFGRSHPVRCLICTRSLRRPVFFDLGRYPHDQYIEQHKRSQLHIEAVERLRCKDEEVQGRGDNADIQPTVVPPNQRRDAYKPFAHGATSLMS